MIYTVTITGHVPAKKNGKHAWKGRVVIDPEARSQADWLKLQLCRWWGRREPIGFLNRLGCLCSVRDGRADLDGKFTTIQDCLAEAGVLVNDSIARVPLIWCGSNRTAGEETAEIEIVTEEIR